LSVSGGDVKTTAKRKLGKFIGVILAVMLVSTSMAHPALQSTSQITPRNVHVDTSTSTFYSATTPVGDNVSAKVANVTDPYELLPHLEVSPASTTFGPSSLAPAVGDVFNISIVIKNLTASWQVVAYQFELTYNNTLLNLVSVTEGPFLRDPRWNLYGTFFAFSSENNSVLVGEVIYPNVNGTWDQTVFPNGDGTVATVTFKVMYQGQYPQVDTSPMNLTSPHTFFVNVNSTIIPSDPPVNGNVTILGVFTVDVAVNDITASAYRVIRGEVVTINVTLENDGELTENITVYITCCDSRNITLAAKTSTITTFYVDTSRMNEGNYPLWAFVPPCPGDEDPCNNIYIGGTLQIVSIPSGGGSERSPYAQ
jgi:hypothetical protein